MSKSPQTVRRTRFVCISDTHNCTVKLPKGDVLIHAGDLTNQGSYIELSRAIKWLEAADFESKIVVAGNHDITLDRDFYAEHGAAFHNKELQSPDDCHALLRAAKSITYLQHESRLLKLTRPSGPKTTFKVFASPYSPRHGLWAFGYNAPSEEEGDGRPLTALWDDIPDDADVVVTHTPPRGHCDGSRDRATAGCESLRRALGRVRPRLAVSGHVHEGRGSQRVHWDPDGSSPLEEMSVETWVDPAPTGGKICLVDLTRRGGRPLDNDGGTRYRTRSETFPQTDLRVDGGQLRTETPESRVARDCAESGGGLTQVPGVVDAGPAHDSALHNSRTGRAIDPETPVASAISLGVHAEAFSETGRHRHDGRRETCIVNCAIMAKSYPHVGGKELRKPIVVDLDLPVWEGSA